MKRTKLTKTLTALTISLILMVSLLPTAFASSTNIISEATQPELYTALKTQYPSLLDPGDTGFITDDELASLTGYVDLSTRSLIDVGGLEYCTHIWGLNLNSNPILTSIGNLAGMTNLTAIDIGLDTNLADGLSTIATMPNINSLGIANLNLTDLSAISALPLQNLSIFGNKITDLTPLSGMDLSWLSLDSNYVSDLTPLLGMPISYLNCRYNYIDPTPGSADRQVLDTFPFTDYDHQYEITITYNYDTAKGGAPNTAT
jgi:hypothetical protein